MDLQLKNKVAIVAASSKGLGRAIALGLAREGARLTICARRESELEETAREIRGETSAEVLAIPADVSKTGDIHKVISGTLDKYSTVDILVNNAGGPPVGGFLDFSLEDWHKAVELNLFSTVTFSREVLPLMKESNWGRIINITSVAVKEPIDGLILSNSVRAGVTGLAKSLSKEFARYNITVNNICPGRILTDRIIQLASIRAEKEGKTVEEALESMGSDIPAGRIGRPEELASLAVFLASERASYITGTSIQVDGGLVKGLL
ncbi:MAG: SDR family oxidoreductase [Thermodesulfobacteriota bacterium]